MSLELPVTVICQECGQDLTENDFCACILYDGEGGIKIKLRPCTCIDSRVEELNDVLCIIAAQKREIKDLLDNKIKLESRIEELEELMEVQYGI